jgi:hypothetical protein
MALNIILACLVITSILNLALIYDLYNRTTRVAAFTEAVRQHALQLAHLINGRK